MRESHPVSKRSSGVRGLAAILIVGSLAVPLLLAAGCKKDEPPPPSTGYYSGPLKPRGGISKNPGGRTRRGNPGSDL
jgi:hypothetical protein